MDVGIGKQKSKGKDEQTGVGIESKSERKIYGQSITKRDEKNKSGIEHKDTETDGRKKTSVIDRRWRFAMVDLDATMKWSKRKEK